MIFDLLENKSQTKADNALLTITEISEKLDLEPHIIRFWESKFPELIPQKRRGRRYYTPENLALLQFIKDKLYQEGYSIRGVQNLLANNQTEVREPSLARNTETVLNELKKDLLRIRGLFAELE